MKCTKRYAWCLIGCAMLLCLTVLGLVSCQKHDAVWEELDTVSTTGNTDAPDVEDITGDVDIEEISQQIFDESTATPEETESYTVEDSNPGQPGLSVKTPVFSQPGGLYSRNLSVTLTCSDEYTIHYTTNGSIPTLSSPLYEGDISVLSDKVTSTSVRAACFDDTGRIVGDVATHTYVRLDSARNIHTVFITADQSDLDYLYGHYQDSYEKPAHVEILTPEGNMVISQDVGLRIFGGSSRALPQKSFKIIARKDGYFGADVPYNGKGSFQYPLFAQRIVKSGVEEGGILRRYDSFILRNGGNDSLLHRSVDPDAPTLLRDGMANWFAYSMAPHVDASLSQFAHVYINGEYYGILDMRENLNEDYVKRVYGVEDEDVVVVKSELDTSRHCEDHEDGAACRYCNVWFYYETDDNTVAQNALREWETLCRNAIAAIDAEGEAYDRMYQRVAALVDLQSFKEYMALSMYVCNTDWPHNNVKLWKYTGASQEGIAITDGKWRFMTRDMDMAFARYRSPYLTSELDNRADRDTFYFVLGSYLDGYREYYSYEGEERLYPDSLYLQGLLAFCLKNDEFRAEFAAYCRTLAGAEAQAYLEELYQAGFDALNPNIADHIRLWLRRDSSPFTWRNACKEMLDFIKSRGAQFETYLTRMLHMYA